ncbi:MAG: PAS domain S-box protein [Bacteroidetes bacterium]|nr:PAS domain S-box protein [Bacteroidota bacterium]
MNCLWIQGKSFTENDKLFKSLADNAPDVIMRLDSDFRYTFINAQVEKITGIPAEEYLGRTNEEMGMPVELCHYWNLMFKEAAISGILQESEMEFPGSENSSFFNIRVVVEKNESGSVQSYLGIWHNITNRKEWEKSLQESEGNLKHAESLAHIGNYQLNLKTGKCKWSDEFYSNFGL